MVPAMRRPRVSTLGAPLDLGGAGAAALGVQECQPAVQVAAVELRFGAAAVGCIEQNMPLQHLQPLGEQPHVRLQALPVTEQVRTEGGLPGGRRGEQPDGGQKQRRRQK